MEKLLAVMGRPGEVRRELHWRAAVVLEQHENGEVIEALTGEPVSVDSLKAYLEQAQGYVDNLREALKTV